MKANRKLNFFVPFGKIRQRIFAYSNQIGLLQILRSDGAFMKTSINRRVCAYSNKAMPLDKLKSDELLWILKSYGALIYANSNQRALMRILKFTNSNQTRFCACQIQTAHLCRFKQDRAIAHTQSRRHFCAHYNQSAHLRILSHWHFFAHDAFAHTKI